MAILSSVLQGPRHPDNSWSPASVTGDHLDPVGGHALLRDQAAHAQHDLLGQAGIIAVMLERGRIGIHPFDGFPVGAIEAHERVLAVLQRVQIRQVHASAAALERIDLRPGRDDADLAVLDLIEKERNRREADIDLSGHGLGERRGDAAGRGRLGRELVLRNQRKHAGVARRAGERIGDGLAVEVLELADRGIGRNIPIKIGRADDLTADDANRGALREGTDRGRYAGGGCDVDRAADQRLDRFRSGLGVEDFQVEPMLLEDAAALAELQAMTSSLAP